MGVVYVARQISTGAMRALKVMQPQLVSSKDPAQAEKNRTRFLAEARVGSTIASEHVVQVVVAGIDAQTGAPWLAMELLDGSDLKDVLAARERFTPPQVLDLYRQLTHALAAAHRTGVFHLDLKPENIFLARSRRAGGGVDVKVLDFGIAKLVSEHRQSATVTTAMGSPFWMSPEQAKRGMKVGAYSDVWALGLIAFRLLTGKQYWREANVPDNEISVTSWLMEMMTEKIESASLRAHSLGVGQWVPSDFDAWFARCVDRDTSVRFPDAGEAYTALSAALSRVERASVPYAPTQALSRLPPLPVFEPPPAMVHSPKTALMTKPVAGLMDPRVSLPSGVMPVPAGNVSQPLPPSPELPQQAVVGVTAGLLVVALVVIVVKLIGDDGHREASSEPAASVVPVAPPTPTLRPPPAVPSCPAGMVLVTTEYRGFLTTRATAGGERSPGGRS